MAKYIKIKNLNDKNKALDTLKRKIKGLSIPKFSHDYITKLTDSLIDVVKKTKQWCPNKTFYKFWPR